MIHGFALYSLNSILSSCSPTREQSTRIYSRHVGPWSSSGPERRFWTIDPAWSPNVYRRFRRAIDCSDSDNGVSRKLAPGKSPASTARRSSARGPGLCFCSSLQAGRAQWPRISYRYGDLTHLFPRSVLITPRERRAAIDLGGAPERGRPAIRPRGFREHCGVTGYVLNIEPTIFGACDLTRDDESEEWNLSIS